MNWQALWNDGAVISVHALVALLAMGAGAIQLLAPKGTITHKTLGYVWVGAMGVVAVSSFWIHEFQWFGPFSIIHVLSLLVLATLIYSIRAIRPGSVTAHRNSMIQSCTGPRAYRSIHTRAGPYDACRHLWRMIGHGWVLVAPRLSPRMRPITTVSDREVLARGF